MATCNSCGRSIRWALTGNGKRIPIDFEPRADGNIVLRRLGGVDVPIAHVLGRDEAVAEARYVAHFATCPDAETHRQRARRERERRAA